MVNHWGVRFDFTKPTTGVVQRSYVEWLWEEMDNGINLSYEEARREFDSAFARDHNVEAAEDHPHYEEAYRRFAEEYIEDGDTYLIGAWEKVGEAYEPDTAGEYAAIVREFVVQVVWSRRVVGARSLCSPCYPGQVDLDSGPGDYLAYALPADVMGQSETPVREVR
jgi:hypothetical protein